MLRNITYTCRYKTFKIQHYGTSKIDLKKGHVVQFHLAALAAACEASTYIMLFDGVHASLLSLTHPKGITLKFTVF